MKTRWFMLTPLLVFALAACSSLQPAEPQPVPTGDTPQPPASATPAPDDGVTSPEQEGEQPQMPPARVTEVQGVEEVPYVPAAGDKGMTRGMAFIDSAELLQRETYPPQIVLNLKGSLPTPCHQLRVKVNPPDEQKRIQVQVYSVVQPDKICAQMLAPFEQSVELKDLPTGKFTVYVNGSRAGEVDIP